MPTVVIDASGRQKAINSALQYMAHTARLVLIGLQKEEISFSHPEFHKREATLMSSRNATREDFDRELAANLSKKKVGLVVLAGFMRLLSPYFIKKYKNKLKHLMD